MALVPCRECHKQISTTAPSCPHCGVPNPANPPKEGFQWKRLAILIVVVALLGVVFRAWTGGDQRGDSDHVRTDFTLDAGSVYCPVRSALPRLFEIFEDDDMQAFSRLVRQYRCSVADEGTFVFVDADDLRRARNPLDPDSMIVRVRVSGDPNPSWTYALWVQDANDR